MEQHLSTVIHQTPTLGVGVSAHIKVHYQLWTMFLQTQHILDLKKVFQNIHSKFLDILDHLWNDNVPVDDTDITTTKIPTSWDHS